MPARLASVFAQHGHDVGTVQEEGLAGHPDSEVWEAARLRCAFMEAVLVRTEIDI